MSHDDPLRKTTTRFTVAMVLVSQLALAGCMAGAHRESNVPGQVANATRSSIDPAGDVCRQYACEP